MMRNVVLGSLLLHCANPSQAVAKDDRFNEPGDLEQPGGTGKGVTDQSILYPDIAFPLKDAPAYLNSQVYNPGGMHGGPGGQSAKSNYEYPWSDNFCETRSWTVPSCPGGKGHQGQDIRPSTPTRKKYEAVAVSDGIIAQIGEYSVSLQTPDGTIFRYLHLDKATLRVKPLQKVRKHDTIGLVSDNFGKNRQSLPNSTTIHLHFDVKDAVSYQGKTIFTFVPPYTSGHLEEPSDFGMIEA